jgi:hypothetical protein
MKRLMDRLSILLGLAMMVFTPVIFSKIPPERKEPKVFTSALGLFALGLFVFMSGFKGKPPELKAQVNKAAAHSPLDVVLLHWDRQDVYTLRDLLNGGVCVLGRPGSGKSSSSGFQLGKGVVRVPRSAGLILASSDEDREFWERIFALYNRSADLLVFDSHSPLRFNVTDHEMRSGADSREITQFFLTLDETLKRAKRGTGGKNQAFWESAKERTFYNSVVILRHATGRIGAPEVAEFLNDAATKPEQLNDATWRESVHCQYLKRAKEAHKTPAEDYDVDQALCFWASQWPAMDPEVRSSILADTMNVIHAMGSGEIRILLSSETNVSPLVLDKGKWILVNMPVHSKGAGGLAVNAAWKYAVERHVLRRRAAKDTPPIIIWCDEYQNVANSFDSTYIGECRKHRGALVALSQSVHSFHSSMKDDHLGHEVKALLSSFAVKIFHSVGDSETAEYGSSLIGQAREVFINLTDQHERKGDYMHDVLMGKSEFTGSMSEQYQPIVQPNVFYGLKTGGENNGYLCGAIVIKSGEPFRSGYNWKYVEFSQR